jgi:uncharacterized protein
MCAPRGWQHHRPGTTPCRAAPPRNMASPNGGITLGWRDHAGQRQPRGPGAAGPPGRGLSGGVKLGGACLIAVVVISLLFGLNPLFVLVSLQGGDPLSAPTQSAPPPTPSGSAVRDDTKEFVVRILGDTEDTLKTLFGQMGGEYHPPHLVLFQPRR